MAYSHSQAPFAWWRRVAPVYLVSFALATALLSATPGPTIPDYLPDNYPVKIKCLAALGPNGDPVPVSYEDQATLRLCKIRQKDGGWALDLKIRSMETPSSAPIYAGLRLRSGTNTMSEQIFRVLPHPITGVFDLYVSQSCMIGRPGGCSAPANKEMKALFAPFKPGSFESTSFVVELQIGTLRPGGQISWDSGPQDPSKTYRFTFQP